MYASSRLNHDTLQSLSPPEKTPRDGPHRSVEPYSSQPRDASLNSGNIPQVNDDLAFSNSNRGTEPQKSRRLRNFVTFVKRVTFYRRPRSVSDGNHAAVSDRQSQREHRSANSLFTTIRSLFPRSRRVGYGDTSGPDAGHDAWSQSGRVSP
jgi:hypothetical protein